jgi:hypothetical protein
MLEPLDLPQVDYLQRSYTCAEHFHLVAYMKKAALTENFLNVYKVIIGRKWKD